MRKSALKVVAIICVGILVSFLPSAQSASIPTNPLIVNPVSISQLNIVSTVVSGVLQAPANTGVTVNGVVAEVYGNYFYVNNVPLVPGNNTLTVKATTLAGVTTNHSVAISSAESSGLLQVTAEPTSGVAPHKVSYKLANTTADTPVNIKIDFDGNGSIDYTATDPSLPIKFTYSTPGVYPSHITVTDGQNVTHHQTVFVVVHAAAQIDQQFNTLWSGMNSALTVHNLPAALLYLNAQARAKYSRVFTALSSRMPEIIASYSALQRISISSDIGEYAVNRTINGRNKIFLIYFLKDSDGVWRLDSM